MVGEAFWNSENQRILLLQIIALKDVKMTGSDWQLIASKWDNGNTPQSFQKQFYRMKVKAGTLIGSCPESDEHESRENKGIPLYSRF